MKKAISLILALVLCLSLCACGNTAEDNTPYADALEEQAEDGSIMYTSAWLMYSWITKNINSFKNPASVELTGNAYYCKDEVSSEIKFFLVEFRADNSFGGKSVGYAKVTYSGITEIDWQPATVSPSFENEKVWVCGTAFMEDAFKEYMNNNY